MWLEGSEVGCGGARGGEVGEDRPLWAAAFEGSDIIGHVFKFPLSAGMREGRRTGSMGAGRQAVAGVWSRGEQSQDTLELNP